MSLAARNCGTFGLETVSKFATVSEPSMTLRLVHYSVILCFWHTCSEVGASRASGHLKSEESHWPQGIARLSVLKRCQNLRRSANRACPCDSFTLVSFCAFGALVVRWEPAGHPDTLKVKKVIGRKVLRDFRSRNGVKICDGQ